MEEKREVGEDKYSKIRLGNISLVLESYEDIFSDFDPRPFEEKALSHDFLSECRNAARDKEAEIELRLLAPKKKRRQDVEDTIKNRLRNHFHRHYNEKMHELKQEKLRGTKWVLLGAFFLIAAAFLYDGEGIFYHLLLVILEPAGWFTFWTGLERGFFPEKEKLAEFEFYKKMVNVHINFYDY